MPVPDSLPVPPLPEVQVVERRLSELLALTVPGDVRAELLGDATHRGTVRLVGEAVAGATADADALYGSLQAAVPTPEAITALANQMARVTALGAVADRLTAPKVSGASAAPMFHGSPFEPREMPATPAPTAAPRWSSTVTGYISEVTSLPAPPDAPQSRYQKAVVHYDRWQLGFGDQSKRPAMPRSCDADLVADEAARDYYQRVTDDRATLSQLQSAAAQVRAGAVDPLDILATADFLHGVRLPESLVALETLTALIADADAGRTARGLDN